MVFSSLVFLCLFLQVFLIIYFLFPKHRVATLVASSLVFYAYGEPVWVLVLLLSGIVNYFGGLRIGRLERVQTRRLMFAMLLTFNLGILVIFKYLGFITENFSNIFGIVLNTPVISLPLGISFYTFQAISYTTDIYRGAIKPQRSILKCLAYITMFPQLVAGPIVRYTDIQERLDDNLRTTMPNFSSGITRFAIGLGKKVLLADAAGSAVTTLLEGNAHLTLAGCWLGMLFFMFQIYFDFSGYSDMAIGLGRMIGFNFRENFNYPYIARSVTDFWRRWHISLTSFFRDYVYIPLGGNRRNQIFNIAVVWFLVGLWHGADWNFIVWGMYYGALVIIEKVLLLKILDRLPRFVGHVYMLTALMFSWPLFYYAFDARLFDFMNAAFGGTEIYDLRTVSVLGKYLFLLPILAIGCTPLPQMAAQRVKKWASSVPLEPIVNMTIILLSFISLVGQTYNPFLYFRF